MCRNSNKYRRVISLTILTALLFICNTNHAQIQHTQDSIPGASNNRKDSIPVLSGDTIKNELRSLRSPRFINNKTTVMLDSLKVKASRNLVMRTLYDFIIVSNDPVNNMQFTGTSETNFLEFSGKRIRKIEIIRLEAFGTDINTPLYYDPNKIETLLNKTHIVTHELIIKKNLLFSEGDTVSPLLLSDNERILRQLTFIYDARIIIIPVSDDESDIVIVTKDIYSLGGDFSYKGINSGSFSLFERNVLGIGHGLELQVPYDFDYEKPLGLGINYSVFNIRKSFLDLKLNYFNAQDVKQYGFNISRVLISATTKYAGGISLSNMTTLEDLDTLVIPEPLRYNLQDYWLMRSFLINEESVSRIIIGTRFKNNNVFDRPEILPYSHYNLQKYRIFLGSASFSRQKYYKTSMLYSYGRTEDIPYGGMFRITAGKEINEFKKRSYLGFDISVGESSKNLGYFYSSIGVASFLNNGKSEQGMLNLTMKYFSNLLNVRNFTFRNFFSIDYTRGFDRYLDESITYRSENGFSGFRNDTLEGLQRISISLESVLFSPASYYGFRFAFFVFADASFLEGTRQVIKDGSVLTGLGLGIRIRNNNLVVNTFQVRLGFYPNLPAYSRVNHLIFSGEQLLRPNTFDPGPPSIMQYR
jgi:hypothetical protein